MRTVNEHQRVNILIEQTIAALTDIANYTEAVAKVIDPNNEDGSLATFVRKADHSIETLRDSFNRL